jgi:hypothetical protein
MKYNRLLLSSIIALGLHGGAAVASPDRDYPVDAQARRDAPILETHADGYVLVGDGTESWGIGRRVVQPHDSFPFAGGRIDD